VRVDAAQIGRQQHVGRQPGVGGRDAGPPEQPRGELVERLGSIGRRIDHEAPLA